MLETVVILMRLAQYGAASVLFGSSLFLLYALSASSVSSAIRFSWPGRLVGFAAIVLFFATVLGVLAQTAVMAGSVSAALTVPSLEAVMGMDLGKAALVRAAAAGAAVFVLVLPIRSTPRWTILAGLGGVASASFAWMGHAAATEGAGGTVHLLSDIMHGWAAAAWIGALCAFAFLLWPRQQSAEALRLTHGALQRFSGVGTVLVGTLVVTGLINSWFIVGPENVEGLLTTDYGLLLSLKLVLFAGMLVLASANRFRLTPRLGAALDRPAPSSTAIGALRRSVIMENLLGFGILAAVAWFGTLPPPGAL